MKDVLRSDVCADKLRALADPWRLRLIDCLRSGPKSVGDLSKLLKTEIVTTSHHLAVLRKAGIVKGERKGRFVVYRLPPEVFLPQVNSKEYDHLNLGCCRLEMPKQ